MTNTVDELVEMRDMLKDGRARQIRERCGLSASAVARDLKVTPGAVLMWERGTRAPSGSNALRYARMLRRLAAKARS
jgi:DNA-binding transcriptional regulator YiaG